MDEENKIILINYGGKEWKATSFSGKTRRDSVSYFIVLVLRYLFNVLSFVARAHSPRLFPLFLKYRKTLRFAAPVAPCFSRFTPLVLRSPDVPPIAALR